MRVIAPGDGDHSRRQIDAEDLKSEFVQTGGDVSRPASDVRHRPAARSKHAVGEQRQSGA
ncbi:hypothetical protein [Paractinoplanes ovalisporus]|uniref:hypothetical protein n=1 Tax=Paractinoplanes ovalisporus TaxID=2810368 RepID=UPI0027DB1A5B|nr:hypothetical protein [Actinoplanes ovalisporus]